jgi:hypothetical protein
VTEDPTLLPGNLVDKRSKEVFALSLERMNARTRRGFAQLMSELDGGSSMQRMAHIGSRDCCMPRNSACPESVFFLRAHDLILNALSRQPPKSAKPATLIH